MHTILLTRNLVNHRQWSKISPALSQKILTSREDCPCHIYEHFRRWVTNSAEEKLDKNKSPIKSLPLKYDWNRALSEAERIVGYPTSFLSLRWLLSDEIANMAMYLRKIASGSHPLLKTSKDLLFNGKSSVQVWGLVVLLISKAAGHDPSTPAIEQDKSAGILHTQRGLAELTEMIRISYLIHSTLVNLQKSSTAGQDAVTYDDMVFGNKIGLLIGDYLLSTSSIELGKLRNQEVMGLISSTIRDFSESEFIGDRDEQNNPLPTKPGSQPLRASDTSQTTVMDFDEGDVLTPLNVDIAMGNAEREWEVRNILSGGSLLGKSCKAAMKLSKQTDEMQKSAYLFGKHLHLAWQACLEAEPFQLSSLPLDATFSLVSAPVLFHLEHDPSLYDEIEKGKECVDKVDFANIYKRVTQGPSLEQTKKLQRKHSEAALKALENFPDNDARTTLESIVLGIKD